MKRQNSNSTISKLGESAYNALVMTNQVNRDGSRILHYSYNLSGEEDDAAGYDELTKNKRLFRSQPFSRRAFSKEEKQSKLAFEKELQRSNSIGHLPRNNERSLAGSQFTFYGGATQGNVREQPSTELSKTETQDRVTKNNGLPEANTRKYGLGETSNMSLMSHKLRKKGVCDSTDNSHYQRQFLRVLNKRF